MIELLFFLTCSVQLVQLAFLLLNVKLVRTGLSQVSLSLVEAEGLFFFHLLRDGAVDLSIKRPESFLSIKHTLDRILIASLAIKVVLFRLERS